MEGKRWCCFLTFSAVYSSSPIALDVWHVDIMAVACDLIASCCYHDYRTVSPPVFLSDSSYLKPGCTQCELFDDELLITSGVTDCHTTPVRFGHSLGTEYFIIPKMKSGDVNDHWPCSHKASRPSLTKTDAGFPPTIGTLVFKAFKLDMRKTAVKRYTYMYTSFIDLDQILKSQQLQKGEVTFSWQMLKSPELTPVESWLDSRVQTWLQLSPDLIPVESRVMNVMLWRASGDMQDRKLCFSCLCRSWVHGWHFLCVILEAVHNDTTLNCAASVFMLGSVPVLHLECLSCWPEKKKGRNWKFSYCECESTEPLLFLFILTWKWMVSALPICAGQAMFSHSKQKPG